MKHGENLLRILRKIFIVSRFIDIMAGEREFEPGLGFGGFLTGIRNLLTKTALYLRLRQASERFVQTDLEDLPNLIGQRIFFLFGKGFRYFKYPHRRIKCLLINHQIPNTLDSFRHLRFSLLPSGRGQCSCFHLPSSRFHLQSYPLLKFFILSVIYLFPAPPWKGLQLLPSSIFPLPSIFQKLPSSLFYLPSRLSLPSSIFS